MHSLMQRFIQDSAIYLSRLNIFKAKTLSALIIYSFRTLLVKVLISKSACCLTWFAINRQDATFDIWTRLGKSLTRLEPSVAHLEPFTRTCRSPGYSRKPHFTGGFLGSKVLPFSESRHVNICTRPMSAYQYTFRWYSQRLTSLPDWRCKFFSVRRGGGIMSQSILKSIIQQKFQIRCSAL